jgi:hypothetical protein
VKRRLFKFVVFLLLGAVVNVAVAWGTIARPVWRGMRTSSPEVKGAWPSPVPPHWTPPDLLLQKESFGLVVHQYTGYEWTGDLTRHYSVFVARCGLPVSALQWHRSQEFAPSDPQPEKRLNVFPESSRWEVGVPIPRMLPGFRETYWKALPLHPIWPGFAINTLFYAAILWLLTFGPFTARRIIRRKCGHCISCGYDLRGDFSAGCSECGWQREAGG